MNVDHSAQVTLEDLSKVETVQFNKEIIDSFDFQSSKQELLERLNKIKIVGHRGGFKPDNTQKCFEEANKNGIKYVEIDVYLNKVEELYVVHAGETGQLDQFTKKENTWIQEYSNEQMDELRIQGEPIPKFRDVIQYFKANNIYSFIELKGKNALNTGVRVLEILQKENMEGKAEIISFFDTLIEPCREYIKTHNIQNIPLTAVYRKPMEDPYSVEKYKGFGFDSLSLNGSQLKRDFLIQLKQEIPNLQLNCWWSRQIFSADCKKENILEYLNALDCPMDAVTVDYPLILREIIQYLLQKMTE